MKYLVSRKLGINEISDLLGLSSTAIKKKITQKAATALVGISFRESTSNKEANGN